MVVVCRPAVLTGGQRTRSLDVARRIQCRAGERTTSRTELPVAETTKYFRARESSIA